MFQLIKEYLERGAQKWNDEIEHFLKLKVGATCMKLESLGKDAEELRRLQEMLYSLYNTVSNIDMAKKFNKVGFDIMIRKILDKVISKGYQEKKDWEIIEEQILDVVNAFAENLTDDKERFLLDFCPRCLDLVLKKHTNYLHEIEVLKGCNMILENCTLNTKEKILARNEIVFKLKAIAAKLETLGDYECQVGILECLFRIIPRKQRREYAAKFFHNKEIQNQFMQIKDAQFETDCRVFLNDYNISLSKQLVYSIPCTRAVLGDKKLEKPNDEEYEHFWVDFNTGTKRITLFCEQMNNSENDCDFWETISVRNEDVKEIKLQKEETKLDLDIVFEKPIRTLFPSQSEVKGQHMHIIFPSDSDIELVVEQTLPDCCNIIESSQKASTVEFPVKIQREFIMEIPKPPEKHTLKASSPCTPMHLVQEKWGKDKTDCVQPHIETQQDDQKVSTSDQATTPFSGKKANKRSTSSKTSNAASPLQISSATFYSNFPGKREHKVTTPKVKTVEKKKKVKTPVVTVTPPVKRFRSNVETGKNKKFMPSEKDRKENKTKLKKEKSDVPEYCSLHSADSKRNKEVIGKSVPVDLLENKYELLESDTEDDFPPSDFDDDVEVLQILDNVQHNVDNQKGKQDIPAKETKEKDKVNETICHSDMFKSDGKDTTTSVAVGNRSSISKENAKEMDVLKNSKLNILSQGDAESSKAETSFKTFLPFCDNGRPIKNSNTDDLSLVEKKMVQSVEKDTEDEDDCLMTNACIYTDCDTNNQQGTKNIQHKTGKRNQQYIKNKPIPDSNNNQNKTDKKQQGRKRKPANNFGKQNHQLAPVEEIRGQNVPESGPVNKNMPTVMPSSDHCSPPRNPARKKRGRPKGSKKRDVKPASSPDTQRITSRGSCFALTENTKQCLGSLSKNNENGFHWKDEESSSVIIQPIAKSPSDVCLAESDKEYEDVIEESQEIAKIANDCASNKSLATDLSFKESPWYKCMPQHSKYNTKWFKTYGKVRGNQRQQTGSSQDIDCSGDSPAVKKLSQKVTKTLSLQMTYSSKCVSSPGGDADYDPYTFDDTCSEYSNNLKLTAKQTKQKRARRGNGKSSKKTEISTCSRKDVHCSKKKKSNEESEERPDNTKKKTDYAPEKRGNQHSWDTRRESLISKYQYTDDPNNSISMYQVSNVCQVKSQEPVTRSKKLKTNKLLQRHNKNQKTSVDDDYAISCPSSPGEEFHDSSLSRSPLQSQSLPICSLDSWKPSENDSLMDQKLSKSCTNGGVDVLSLCANQTPKKKHKRSNRSKQHVNVSTNDSHSTQSATPESILSKFRRSCQKLVEESCCSEENVALRLQTPLLAPSPHIKNIEQEESEDQLVCSQTSEIHHSQGSDESRIRPLKRKFKCQEIENSCHEEDNEVMEKEFPVNLLRVNQAANKYRTSDGDKEIMSVSISTASSQDVESVVSERISSFGIEIQHHMQAKKKQIDHLTKDVLKTLVKISLKSCKETREQRTKYIEEFQHIVMEELKAIEKDVSSLKKTEDECMLYFEEKLKEIQRHTYSQEKSIQNLVAAKELFVKQMHHSEHCADKAQLKVKNSLKQELEAMKTRLISKNQQDELENIKRCLRQSFSIG